MLGGIGARRHFAFHRRACEKDSGISHEGITASMQVFRLFFNLIESPRCICLSDFGAGMAPLEIWSTYLAATFSGSDFCIQRLVNPLHDLTKLPPVLGGISAGRELAFHRRL